MKSAHQVLENYMVINHDVNSVREEHLKRYYNHTSRENDSRFTKIESEEYQLTDHCDIFSSSGVEGTTLALYSPIKSIDEKDLTWKCKYPLQILNNNAYTYYGLKLNILLHLSGRNINRLMLYYSNGQSRAFQKKEVYAQIVLDHYKKHYMGTTVQDIQPVPEPKKILLLDLFQ